MFFAFNFGLTIRSSQSDNMPKSKPFYLIQMAQDIPEILIVGYIGFAEDGVTFAQFAKDIKELSAKYPRAKMKVNSPGGSMYDGLAMFDLIQQEKMIIDCDIMGLSASMAAILPLACTGKIRASKNSTYMLHKPKGGISGSSSQMRNYAGQMDELEAKVKAIVKTKTGLSDEVVNGWFVEGKDKYFTAEELLTVGLIDEIIPAFGDVKASGVKMSLESAWAQYESINMQLISTETNNTAMKKQILAMLATLQIVNHGLTEESTDEQFQSKLQEIIKSGQDQLIAVTNKLDQEQTQAIEVVLSAAVASGRIAEADKATYAPLMKANFDGTKSLIEKIPARQDINSHLFPSSEKNQETIDDRKKWSYREWETKDPEGLLALKRTQPEVFNQLFKDFYGQSPE